jgi:hypothetical protein
MHVFSFSLYHAKGIHIEQTAPIQRGMNSDTMPEEFANYLQHFMDSEE